MFIAMNRFRVMKDCGEAFETVWRNRESRLREVPGFVSFALLKGPEREDHRLYASHTLWRDKADFEAWTRSDQFRTAHAEAGRSQTRALYLGGPEFEGFESVLTLEAGAVEHAGA